ncbi:UNVERIFIED_CONTAM: hypothetical protein FKN15_048285 [Acipenser sinensis]
MALPNHLPGVMMNGQAQSKVTLHHHVYVHLCAFIASVPRECFPPLVSVYTQTETDRQLLEDHY